MIGDVGGEIGGLAVVALHHSIFLITKGAGAKPQRAFFLIDIAGGTQPMEGLVDRTLFLQGAL